MSKHNPPVTVPGQATREELVAFAESLRRLADFVEVTDAPIKSESLYVSITAADSANDFAKDPQARAVFESRPRTLLRSIKGKVDKIENGDTMRLQRRFDTLAPDTWSWAGRVGVNWVISRDAVCVATPTGKMQTVKLYGQYTDAETAESLRKALDALTKTEVRPVMEYDCKPILGADEVVA